MDTEEMDAFIDVMEAEEQQRIRLGIREKVRKAELQSEKAVTEHEHFRRHAKFRYVKCKFCLLRFVQVQNAKEM